MSFISDYNPLHQIKVRGLDETIAARGLIVIVGPNSSGKTRFLRDIENILFGWEARPLVVCEEIYVQKPVDGNVFVKDLLDQRLLLKSRDHPGTVQAAVPNLGRGSGDNSNRKLESLSALCAFADGPTMGMKNEFFSAFGGLLTTSLFLENRMTLYSPQSRYDRQAVAPQNELQALYANSSVQDRLEAETGQVFRNAVWLDITTMQNQLVLRGSGGPDPVPFKDRLDVDKAAKYRPLADEGDGLKSFAGIAISLLLGRRPVCLIDEPELCLHPPQAYALGKFIGAYGTGEPHVTFVATHSSHTLRGIIETASKVTVVRLTNVAGQFRGHRLEHQELRAALSRRTTRVETVLDGIFSQAVAIVEGEGDRAVYQAAAEGIEHEFGGEIHFVSVNGTPGINEICRFYRTLRIPVAIIADLDVITDMAKMTSFLEQLASAPEATDVLAMCKTVEAAVRDIPPTITENEVSQELDQIKCNVVSWAKRDDVIVFSMLSSLRNRIDRLHELKKAGRAAFAMQQEIQRDLDEVVRRCKAVGLYLVPCGQLENWVPHLMQDVSKNQKHKWRWADEAARRIQDVPVPERKGDLWQFIQSVTTFLHAAASTK
jgi:AAA domain, putative AbiEii toxin, Type IV TA system